MTRSVLFALATVLMSNACSSASEPNVSYFPLTGSIVARDLKISIGDPPSIHVKAEKGDACGVIYLVTPDSRIRRGFQGSNHAASYADLKVGTKVRVWSRVILESCPGQSGADSVLILP